MKTRPSTTFPKFGRTISGEELSGDDAENADKIFCCDGRPDRENPRPNLRKGPLRKRGGDHSSIASGQALKVGTTSQIMPPRALWITMGFNTRKGVGLGTCTVRPSVRLVKTEECLWSANPGRRVRPGSRALVLALCRSSADVEVHFMRTCLSRSDVRHGMTPQRGMKAQPRHLKNYLEWSEPTNVPEFLEGGPGETSLHEEVSPGRLSWELSRISAAEWSSPC